MSTDHGDDSDEGHSNRSRQNLVAIIVVALLFVGGWWLMSELQHHREVQDCIASGRHDCVPILPDAGK